MEFDILIYLLCCVVKDECQVLIYIIVLDLRSRSRRAVSKLVEDRRP
jgi:hypothetical protein